MEDSAEEEINSKNASLDVNHISEYGAKIFSYPKCGLKPLADNNYSQEQYLPPDENIEYLKIGPHSVGDVKTMYEKILEEAYSINDRYTGVIRGHYVPIFIKVKEIKKENDYKKVIINGETFVQMICCLDSGSDTGLVDEGVAELFELGSIGEKNLRLNTVTGTQIKTFKEAEVSCLGTNGIEYQ